MNTNITRWLVLILIIILIPAGCKKHQKNALHSNMRKSVEVDPKGLLMGTLRIFESGTRVLAIDRDSVGVWNTTNEHFQGQFIEEVEGGILLALSPNEIRFFTSGDKWRDKKHRNCLIFINTIDLTCESRVFSPYCSEAACWCNHNTIVLTTPYKLKNKDDIIANQMSSWRLAKGKLSRIAMFDNDGALRSVSSLGRINDELVAAHFEEVLPPKDYHEPWEPTAQVAIWNVQTGQILHCAATEVWTTGKEQLHVAEGAQNLALCSPECIEVRKVNNLELVKRKQTSNDNAPHVAAVSPDGRYVAYGYKRLEVWDLQSNKTIVVDRLKEATVESIEIHDPDTGYLEPLDTVYARHELCLADLRFSSDGKRLFAVTHDGDFTVWEVPTWKKVRQVQLTGNK